MFSFLLLVIIVMCGGAGTLWASADSRVIPARSENQSNIQEKIFKDIDAEWGGYVRVRGDASRPDDESFYQLVGTGTYYDGSAEGRLKNRLYFGTSAYFDAHYEIVLSGGDTRRKGKKLEKLFPAFSQNGFLAGGQVDDDRRLMDLTKTIEDYDNYTLYHRLDRLSFTVQPKWCVVRIGRQAVTWGNGLLFNPMDLFNPFAPTDTAREYKIGDDMVSTQFPVEGLGDVQFLYVPRRNPSNGDVEEDQSSLAGKLHFALGTTEFDIMAAEHFKDEVAGIGGTGYLGNAAWRLDATWTFTDKKSDESDFLSLVANIDYSWVWWEKNFYGFVEGFYNGLGDDDYSVERTDPDIVERLDRGELFTLGRYYLAGHIKVELHPLVNVCLTVINNITDPSGILQPRLTWDVIRDVQLICGGNLFYGGRETEYGGFKVPGNNSLNKAPDNVYIWLTYFF